MVYMRTAWAGVIACDVSNPSRVTQHSIACRTSTDSTGPSEAPATLTPASNSERNG